MIPIKRPRLFEASKKHVIIAQPNDCLDPLSSVHSTVDSPVYESNFLVKDEPEFNKYLCGFTPDPTELDIEENDVKMGYLDSNHTILRLNSVEVSKEVNIPNVKISDGQISDVNYQVYPCGRNLVENLGEEFEVISKTEYLSMKNKIEENDCKLAKFLVEKEYFEHEIECLKHKVNTPMQEKLEKEIQGLKKYVCLLSSKNKSEKDELAKLKGEVAKHEEEKTQIMNEKVMLWSKMKSLMKDLDAKEALVKELDRSIVTQNTRLANLQGRILALTKERNYFEKQCTQLREELESRKSTCEQLPLLTANAKNEIESVEDTLAYRKKAQRKKESQNSSSEISEAPDASKTTERIGYKSKFEEFLQESSRIKKKQIERHKTFKIYTSKLVEK